MHVLVRQPSKLKRTHKKLRQCAILKCITEEIRWEGVDELHDDQYTIQQCTLVNMVINLFGATKDRTS